jgi:signal peptidase I
MDAEGRESDLLDLVQPTDSAESDAARRGSHRLTTPSARQATPRRGTRAQLRGRRRRRTRRIQFVGLFATLALMISVRAWAFEAYLIPSPSMEATLQVGDRVLVDKFSYRFGRPQRGQVVVFDGADSFDPASSRHHGFWDRVLGLVGAAPDEDDFIKRVIGLPGDHVRCCDDQGRLLINGVALTESYLFPGDVPSLERFDVMVPRGRLWVMGDHRSRSADSRAHIGDPGGGTVPIGKVVGRAVAIVWPLGHRGRLPIPAGFQRLSH